MNNENASARAIVNRGFSMNNTLSGYTTLAIEQHMINISPTNSADIRFSFKTYQAHQKVRLTHLFSISKY